MPENVPLESESPVEEGVSETSSEDIVRQKRGLLSRFGCGVLLVFWFMLLMTPCALLYLASNGEIRIWHSEIPEPHSHPRFLVELITEVDYRGLRVVNSTVIDPINDDHLLCVQTNVKYLLWESAEDNQDTAFCDCYGRQSVESEWLLNETIAATCPVD